MKNSKNSSNFSVNELIKKIKVIGQEKIDSQLANSAIHKLASLNNAKKNELTFCTHPKWIHKLETSNATIVLINKSVFQALCDQGKSLKKNWLVCENARFEFDKLCAYFFPQKLSLIHPTATISCAQIGKNAYIGAGSFIGEKVKIGDNAFIYPNVTILDRVEIGDNVIIHSGTVIGSDGFGFELINNKVHKQPQIRSVKIGNQVEIGSNCSIDRGSIDNTQIADEVKIDNLVHIAHNVKIGAQTAIMGCVGIAGGAEIGKNCIISGMVAINGYIKIADGVNIYGHSTVTKNILEPKSSWASLMRLEKVPDWKRNRVLFSHLKDKLSEIDQRLQTLEKLSQSIK